MSSHHFVREDQEPALLILDAEAVPFEQTQELLEWSPTVIVQEAALPIVMNWGIKMDVVVAPTENIPSLTASLHDQFPLKLISCNAPTEVLSTAAYFLIASKQKAVNILSNEALETFESYSVLDLSVFQLGKRWSFIRNGVYEKWLPIGRTVYIHPANQQSPIKTDRDGVIVINRENGFWVSEE